MPPWVQLILFLLVIGFLGWVVTVLQMEETIRKIVVGVIVFITVVAVFLFVLHLFGFAKAVALF